MDYHNIYHNPLVERYARERMIYNFSAQKKFSTWRELWIFLAEAQQDLGLYITDAQIKEMKKYKDNINWDKAQFYEKEFSHDVMAHIYAYGDQVPLARPIIHLGATSAYVGDNTDLILMREALFLVKESLILLLNKLCDFALEHKSIPTLGYTHLQPAQLTTVGKRACLWIQSFFSDLTDLEYVLDKLPFLGVKGTTGTQASFKKLFNDDYQKVKQLDLMITQKAGFKKKQYVSGQTYDRKIDSMVVNLLSQIAQSAHKMTNDIRFLQHMQELEEPFNDSQIGSSAMAYKRNPILSERVGSLAKFVMSLQNNTAMVASTQWLERTLDDSANRRLTLPQGFLATDALLYLSHRIVSRLTVYPEVIKNNLEKEMPFIATENILMECVSKGKDRQEIHHIIKDLCMQQKKRMREENTPNTLINNLAAHNSIPFSLSELEDIIKPEKYIGFSAEQVEEFIQDEVLPVLYKYQQEQLLDFSF